MDFLKKMYGLSRKRAEALDDILDIRDVFPIRPFGEALIKKGMSVIAEVKYATPAEGDLGLMEKPEELALKYERAGASAISCLTEPEFFKGSLDYLRRIRMRSTLPLMMKDFITDKRQIIAGRMMGADAYLLISEMLTLDELKTLHAFGKNLGMEALVEVHGEEGLEKALFIDAGIMGVNCRNLSTLKLDLNVHEKMSMLLPAGCIKVAESGISTSARIKELGGLGYDAALIGRAMANDSSMKEVLPCG
ncbi:MAG TPA: indole-3-glycerol-phosphate synthase [Desulfomonilia bacterium]